MLNTIKGVIFGHAVADALGVPVEFCTRDELDIKSVIDMEGFGTYNVPAGYWSDDTSMTLAALESLANGHLDYNEIMDNFCAWLGDGKFTPDGDVFDVGASCRKSILLYAGDHISAIECGQDSEWDNGNGSLMRILPFILYTYYKRCDNPVEIIHNASRMTHAHERSLIACGIYAHVVWSLLEDHSVESVYRGLAEAERYYSGREELEHFSRLFELDFAALPISEIKSSGYVVDTLEASIWCLLNSKSYKDCVLRAVNLGEDTDTVGAIAGGMAGAVWGYSDIPEKWIKTLARRDYIEELCIKSCRRWYC